MPTTAPQGSPADAEHDREIPEADLLSPLTIRQVVFRNRIVMSPMCQYSAEDGMAIDWRMVHLGSRAVGGVALVMAEATAIAPEGRISALDLGIWSERHAEALRPIARFIASQGAVPGIQLAHAGRKGSSDAPWKGGNSMLPAEGGWSVPGASPIPFKESGVSPIPLDAAGIQGIVEKFESATIRAINAGFQVIEIHAAHGYLLHQFLSPLSNNRTDEYGGSLENRMRFVLRVAERVRRVVPNHLPLFVRISATDWVEGGWDIEDSVILSGRLKDLGVDLIDVSSGGTVPTARIPVGRGYQVPFARRIRNEAKILTGAVGMICDAPQANEIITGGGADLAFIGRKLLRRPYWALEAEHELQAEPQWPIQYGYAVKRRAK